MNQSKLLFIVLLIFLSQYSCAKKVSDDEVIAVVGDRKIAAKEFREDFELSPKYNRSKRGLAAAKQHLEAMTEKQLLVLEAEAIGLDNDKKMQTRLKWVERTAVRDRLYKQEIREKVNIPEKELRAEFLKYNKAVRARHILVETEEEAYEIIKRLQRGEDFAELARSRFKDPDLKKSGGDLGYFTLGDLDAAFEKAAFDLDVGQFSKPVKTRWGYHIIKVEDVRRNIFITEGDYDSKKATLIKLIKKRKEKAAASQFVRDFMTAKNIKVKKEAFLLVFSQSLSQSNEADKRIPMHVPTLIDTEIGRLRQNLDAQRDELLLEYNGGKWTIGDFLDKLPQMPLTQRPHLTSPGRFRNDLAGMLRDELLAQEGYARNLQKTPEVQTEVKTWRDEMLALAMKRKITSDVSVSAQEVSEYYETHNYKFMRPKAVKIQKMVVASKKEAETLLKKARAAKDFTSLVKRHSLADDVAETGGTTRYFGFDDYGQVGKIAFELKLGNFSKVVELNDGRFAFFKVIGHKSQQPIELEKVRDRVKAEIVQEKKAEKYRTFVAGLREQTEVSINEKLLLDIAGKLDFKERIDYVQTKGR